VYAWTRKFGGPRAVVIKGDSRAAAPISQPSPVDVGPQGKRVQWGVKVWPVNGSMIKEELYRWLRLDRPTEESGEPYPPGYCHFPRYGEEYFKQLTAEQLVTKVVKGYRRTEWQKIRDGNEALDVRIYARAAAAVYGMDRFNEAAWRALEGRIAELAKRVGLPAAPQPPSGPPQRRIRGGFFIDEKVTFRWLEAIGTVHGDSYEQERISPPVCGSGPGDPTLPRRNWGHRSVAACRASGRCRALPCAIGLVCGVKPDRGMALTDFRSTVIHGNLGKRHDWSHQWDACWPSERSKPARASSARGFRNSFHPQHSRLPCTNAGRQVSVRHCASAYCRPPWITGPWPT
jgi:hypothetical protein